MSKERGCSNEQNHMFVQVEGLLDRIGGQPPVIEFLASELERLGYASWAHRTLNAAGLPPFCLP